MRRRTHKVDAIATRGDERILVSLKWQQTGGTAEQKVRERIAEHVYYYWRKRLRETEPVRFALSGLPGGERVDRAADSVAESMAGNVRLSLYLLLGSVGLVLLIGCVI